MTRRSCAIYATGIVCAHLLIVGIALMVGQVFPTMIQERIKKEITLAQNSRVLQGWINPPPPVYMQYFFFNVTNPEQFKAGLEKPHVTQVGPYTYREYRPRENVTYLENGTKVFATNPKSFVFLPEMSSGNPEVDVVTIPNIPFIAIMNELNSYSFFIRPMISLYIESLGVDLFMTRSVHEILWGFKDPLMTKIHALKPDVPEYFGLMYQKNGTHEGEFVFHTGEQNYMDYGKIETWNGIRKMKWWSSEQSNMINGTDGSVFHTFLSRDELLYILAADLCRSIHLGYVKDKEVKGIPAFRFASPEENPDNAGFCVPANDCLGKGVLKVSVCRDGAPIVVSFPHFYQADKRYIEAIDGMNPNKEEHETYLDLNPTTGVPIRACKRAQLNVIMKRVHGFPSTRFLNETIFPIMYVNEHIEQTLLETLYRHRSTLETIFRIVDSDNSGVISFEDFRQTWKLLSAYLKMEISDEVINDLLLSSDMNQDGCIDIDEFMESFRLVDRNMLEKGKSLFQRKSVEEDLSQDNSTTQTTEESMLLTPPQ